MTHSASIPRTEAGAPRAGLSVTTILFWVLLAVGIAWRVVWIFSNAYILDSDRSVLYLMAMGVREGHLPGMYWGQGYGGSVLPLVAGAVMLVTGPHVEVVSIVSILFFAGAALLVRAIGKEAAGDRAGNIAGIIFWFPGYPMLWLTIVDPGFYGPSLVFALGVLYLALRGGRAKSWLVWGSVGLLAGLAVWQSPAGGALAFAPLVMMTVRDRRPLRWLVGIAGAVVGALPWLVVFFTARATVTPLGGAGIMPRNFLAFFTEMYTSSLSALQPSAVRWTVTALLIALFVVLIVVGVRQRNRWFIALFAGAVLAYLVIVIGAGVPLQGDSYRYSIFVLPALAVGAAWVLSRVRIVALVALFVFPVLTLTQTALQNPGFALGTSARYGTGMSALIAKLDELHATSVYADYWVAYSLGAATDGRITGDALTLSRYQPYADAAAAADPVVVVVYENLENDQLLTRDPSLPQHTRTTAGGYAIYSFARPFDVGTVWWNLF